MRRVDEAMREVLSDTLTKDVKDPRVGFVTITDVKTSPDLRHARVYVSVLGDAAAIEASLDGLRSAQGFLQARINSELRLKRTPELRFEHDDTAERAVRLQQIIDRELEAGAMQAADQPPAPAVPGAPPDEDDT
jgi:ribosome-binding factor A